MASFAMILSNLQNSCPFSHHPLLLCSHQPPTLLPLSRVPLVQASPSFLSYIGSDFSFPYTLAVQPPRRARVQFTRSCRARAGILVHISPTHGISNGNGNSSSILTTAVDAAWH